MTWELGGLDIQIAQAPIEITNRILRNQILSSSRESGHPIVDLLEFRAGAALAGFPDGRCGFRLGTAPRGNRSLTYCSRSASPGMVFSRSL